MKVEEIRGLSTEELAKQEEAARKELFELRFKLATRQLVNHRQIREVKKTIARLSTILRERELGIR
ncbi:MAG: 50S ribosomal protein L29 [Chloroflexi bacterium RBG_16_51_9]|nr:MAG: 50S ribosomal protein L29 [Chloroflexi bacterium RBG_16_51_9]HLB27960.1 50S ribosomal protein L29 [Dehalococcoidales bacterium]